MADNTFADKDNRKTPAAAGVSPAVRHEQPDFVSFDYSDDDDTDISKTVHGSKAVTGKALWSPNSAAHMAREAADQQHIQAQERQRTEALELAHLAAWNAQMTMLGGMTMTNAEAQEARQHIIDHADEYADKAVHEGRIREDERDDYIHTAKRIHDLEEKRGRGISSADEDRECDQLKKSKIGEATEKDAAEYHAESNKRDLDSKLSTSTSRAALSSGQRVDAGDLFQSAPDATTHFTAANAATSPLEDKSAPPPQAVQPRDVAQTGFNPT